MRAFLLLLSLLFLMPQPVVASDTHGATKEHDHEEQHADEDGDHKASAHGVTALHAWIRATSGEDALLYVEIENGSDQDIRIVGGETAIADSVELVGFRMKDGEAGYAPLQPVPVKPGKELMLEPNGLALRLNGLTRSFGKGEEFEIEIEFDVGHVELHAQVEAADATRHSHAGHQH
ncbi:copper chaperone PCu(A)C [Roseibium sp.]|uniref:copper chaperone PCu(A)C n=1 Tax=Roseibium sp. TaxID=1936156 RepID=UPI003266DAF2